MKPFGIPGIVVVRERIWTTKTGPVTTLDCVCDNTCQLCLGLDDQVAKWVAYDAILGDIMASGRSRRAAIKAALLRWRQEIDAKDNK